MKMERPVSGLVRLLEFQIGTERYGLPMEPVEGVLGLAEGAGETEIDGEVVPVIEGGAVLGLRGGGGGRRGVVVRGRGRAYVLAVDEVQGLLEVDSAVIVDPPERAAGEGSALVLGIARVDGSLIVILDPEALAP